LVAKIDTSEAFVVVRRLRNGTLALGFAVSLLAILTATLIARSISAPIVALHKGSEIIGSGDLDYKVGTAGRDEIGQLARAFDRMTESLKKVTASRDELDTEIGERKLAEEKLQSTLEDLERSNKELQQFAYVASHDLQEPLRMVASYTQLLEKHLKDKLDADAKEFIYYAVDGATRMQMLIEDLLAYSRIGARGKPLKPTDCNRVLRQVIGNLGVAIEENQAIITHDRLPTVTVDAVQMRQLLQNLIGNAIKFKGPEAPRVHIRAEQRPNEWLFSVRDNGIGIDPQYKERIFAIFQRLHSRQEYRGTGIGLAICNRIVERHGGRIWVRSELGKGSTFFFTIPAPPDRSAEL
jgi:light-regulated signal transduction histidine kinase (bacteriophytochrome)